MPRRGTLCRFAPLMTLMALLALSVAELSSHDKADCVEPEGHLELGETTEISIDSPMWLSMLTRLDHVYRLDVSGPDGSSLELWEANFDSMGYCLYSSEPIKEREISGSTTSVEWSSQGTALQVIPPSEGETAAFSLTLSEVAAPPEDWVWVIPAVAHSPGLGETFFQTDLWLFNPFDEPVEVELVLVPGAEAEQSFLVTVEPQQNLTFDDVVLSLFGRDDTTGALRIHCSHHGLIATSRTYNTSDSGSFGQFVAAQKWRFAAGSGIFHVDDKVRRLLHLADSASFRSNVGFVEVLGLDAEIELEMFDDMGSSLASATLFVPANSHRQINDVFDFLGAPARDNTSLTINLTSNARVFPYASVVDNLSSDPIFVPGLSESDASTVRIVVAAAATAGSHGTQWQTDLRVLALDKADWLRISFVPNDSSLPSTENLDPPGPGVLAIDDVVRVLGRSGTGALFVRSNARILVTSRTYNVTDEGSLGQFIPARGSMISSSNATMLGVSGSSDFRTNIGMLNEDNFPADVTLRLVSENGSLLGSGTWNIKGLRHMQINDIFATLNTAGQTNCRVDVEVADFRDRILTYASVIDNRSGDSILVPAVPSMADLQSTIELSNRDNAFLIDQLPEAQGVVALPAGTLTATLTGSGDLGRPNLPIQVLCLYKDGVGELQSAVLAIGDSLSGIAGQERFWCVIPDWISSDDNSGSVTVTITGGDEVVTLPLDAQANAVLLDGLQESVLAVQPSAGAYQVEVTGDLGRPELAPQVVVMFRDDQSGQLKVRTFGDGETFGGIDTDFQFLVTIADWINRDDNTGTTSLVKACTKRAGACNTFVQGSLSENDCESGPLGANFPAESISFDGTAGQIVTINLDWAEAGTMGHLHLLDPSGSLIALKPITAQTLPATGTYMLWISTNWYRDEYLAEITCAEP